MGTTVVGIQTAITLYTLAMASLMIPGGKIGQIIGRKRAFSIGCAIYGCGSFTTAISPSLGVLVLRGRAFPVAAFVGLTARGRREASPSGWL